MSRQSRQTRLYVCPEHGCDFGQPVSTAGGFAVHLKAHGYTQAQIGEELARQDFDSIERGRRADNENPGLETTT